MKRFDKNKFIEIREEKGYSQNDVAYLNDLALNTVKNWEENDVLPNADNIGKLAEFFDVKTDYFYTEVEE